MIRLTRKTDYGIVLMTHFARHPERVFHNARGMAEETRLPLPIVSHVLKKLARAELLLSQRGTRGGYRLGRRPEEISVLDVIRAIEGPIALTECTLPPLGLCTHEPLCAVRSHWGRINRAFLDAIANLNLAAMALPPAVFDRRFASGGGALAAAARPEGRTA
jgi:FeS assembly SUF system regulator